ncbi:hypothetical protein PAPHI01_0746 [Pancytospora philotis]|nr:hypothetical protein PAPHI01_0746 [Pancytospora philotis]
MKHVSNSFINGHCLFFMKSYGRILTVATLLSGAALFLFIDLDSTSKLRGSMLAEARGRFRSLFTMPNGVTGGSLFGRRGASADENDIEDISKRLNEMRGMLDAMRAKIDRIDGASAHRGYANGHVGHHSWKHHGSEPAERMSMHGLRTRTPAYSMASNAHGESAHTENFTESPSYATGDSLENAHINNSLVASEPKDTIEVTVLKDLDSLVRFTKAGMHRENLVAEDVLDRYLVDGDDPTKRIKNLLGGHGRLQNNGSSKAAGQAPSTLPRNTPEERAHTEGLLTELKRLFTSFASRTGGSEAGAPGAQHDISHEPTGSVTSASKRSGASHDPQRMNSGMGNAFNDPYVFSDMGAGADSLSAAPETHYVDQSRAHLDCNNYADPTAAFYAGRCHFGDKAGTKARASTGSGLGHSNTSARENAGHFRSVLSRTEAADDANETGSMGLGSPAEHLPIQDSDDLTHSSVIELGKVVPAKSALGASDTTPVRPASAPLSIGGTAKSSAGDSLSASSGSKDYMHTSIKKDLRDLENAQPNSKSQGSDGLMSGSHSGAQTAAKMGSPSIGMASATADTDYDRLMLGTESLDGKNSGHSGYSLADPSASSGNAGLKAFASAPTSLNEADGITVKSLSGSDPDTHSITEVIKDADAAATLN